MKACSTCREAKEAAAFYRCNTTKDGLQYSCKDCQRKARTEWARQHPEQQRQWRINYEHRNLEAVREAKRQVARRGYEKNKPKKLAANKVVQERNRNDLAKDYVARLIARTVGCRRAQIPEELINAKRKWLRASRALKERNEVA